MHCTIQIHGLSWSHRRSAGQRERIRSTDTDSVREHLQGRDMHIRHSSGMSRSSMNCSLKACPAYNYVYSEKYPSPTQATYIKEKIKCLKELVITRFILIYELPISPSMYAST